MYRIVLDKEHKQILQEAMISFCKIRLNEWSDYVNDLDISNDKTNIILLFEKAYETASPDYKNIYRLIRENDKIVDIDGFEIKDIYLKVFDDNLIFSLKEIKQLLYVVEEFMRMRMGQFFMFADDVAENGWGYDSDDPDNSIKFDAYIKRRNESQDMFEKAYRNAIILEKCKSEKVLIAEDMYDVFKHQIWLDTPSMHEHYTVYSNPPMLWSRYKMPKIEEVEK